MLLEEHMPEGKDEGEKARNTERIEREQTAAGETPERIEPEMYEIRNRMAPDLSDLREHVGPQAVKEQIKRSLRDRFRGILNSVNPTSRRR